MAGADIVFGCFLLYGLVFGMRRGFYKELVAFIALVLAVAVARTWRDAAGELLHTRTQLPEGLAHVLGTVLVFAVVFFVINVIGRIALKKLRDPDKENRLEAAAEKVADSAEGDTTPGPVTLLTNPVATAQRQIVYWSDKILGGLLGILKGMAAAYALFAVVYFVDLHMGNMGAWKESIENSAAKRFYVQYLASLLRQFPEYRLLENAANMEHLAKETKGEPQLIDRLAQDAHWNDMKATQVFHDLALDPEIQGMWLKVGPDGKRDLNALLHSPKVRHLLTDEKFQEAFENADIESVIRAAANPPPAPPK